MNTKTTPATTSTATSDPAPAPVVKTPKQHGLLDKHQLAEISKANTIYGMASDPATFALIKDDQIITDDFMTKLGADLQTMNQYTGGATEAAVGSLIETTAEAAAKKVLLGKIHYIQSKAKLKYAASKGVLPEYGIGQRITLNRAILETAAGNVINKLKTDTLPKVGPQHATDLQIALDGYRQTKVDQMGGKGDAMGQRVKLADMVESLAIRRRQLQHAVDGEFPFTDPANAGMRKKFDLPPDHPLNP